MTERPDGPVREGGSATFVNLILDRCRRYLAYALLATALIIGGGGGPLLDLIVELLGVALLVATLSAPRAGLSRGTGWAIAAVVLIAAVPLLQIVPLPASIWRGLPGRGIAITARDALGVGGRAFPLSLDPEATWRSALYLVPAIAMFLSTLHAGQPERRRLVLVGIACIFVGMLAGVLQVTFGSDFYPYPTAHQGNAVGLLINRNHEATLLLIGVALVAMLAVPAAATRADAARSGRARPGRARATATRRGTAVLSFLASPSGVWVLVGLMVMFSLAVITTTSRAGMVAMPLALAAALTRVVPFAGSQRGPRLGIVVAVVVFAALIALLATNSVTQSTVARFVAHNNDGRSAFWADTIAAIRPFWPLGSGLGTFVPVYASFESLDNVAPNYANHAHDEYLELLLETGIFAIAAAGAYILAVVAAFRQPLAGGARQQRVCAIIGIAVVVLHSAVDYPLRIIGLITVFGLLNGLLFDGPRAERAARDPEGSGKRPLWFAFA